MRTLPLLFRLARVWAQPELGFEGTQLNTIPVSESPNFFFTDKANWTALLLRFLCHSCWSPELNFRLSSYKWFHANNHQTCLERFLCYKISVLLRPIQVFGHCISKRKGGCNLSIPIPVQTVQINVQDRYYKKFIVLFFSTIIRVWNTKPNQRISSSKVANTMTE